MARRVLLIVLGVLVVVLVLLAGAVGYFALSPLPKTNGTISAPGLQATVTIYRDEWGVPQIYADNSHDLFFAQGYVHAQDRLFQLDFQRRVGLGRLSEVLGEATLDTDRFLRTLGTNRAAQQDLDAVAVRAHPARRQGLAREVDLARARGLGAELGERADRDDPASVHEQTVGRLERPRGVHPVG